MKAKTIVTIILLALVAGSIALIVSRELGRRAEGEDDRKAGLDATGSADTPPPDGKRQTIAYYLHGSARCASCQKIEAFSKAAIEQSFPDELVSGRLVWRVVNVEEAGNEHFVKDFQLYTQSLVLVDEQGGAAKRWKNLADVWKLLGDKSAFAKYVRDETTVWLRGE